MIPDFKILFDGSDRTEVIRPLLNSIMVVDKPGVEADTANIKLKATEALEIPDSGTDVSVSFGYRDRGILEVFKEVANWVGLSGPGDELFIQATGVPLSDDKRMQGSHERSWNEPLTLGGTTGHNSRGRAPGAGAWRSGRYQVKAVHPVY